MHDKPRPMALLISVTHTLYNKNGVTLCVCAGYMHARTYVCVCARECACVRTRVGVDCVRSCTHASACVRA